MRIIVVALCLLFVTSASAADLKFSWTHSTPERVKEYTIHLGSESGVYTRLLVTPNLSMVVHDLDLPVYAVVSAEGTLGELSPMSEEAFRLETPTLEPLAAPGAPVITPIE